MLEIKNLTKIYRPKRGVPVKALDNVSLKFPDKGMVFILGKSGSGKSTLLNVLGGLDSFSEGEFIIKGEAAKGFKQMHYDSYRNTYIGFIFQEYNILKDFSVGANIALALELQGRHADDETINSILKKVDLEGYGDRKPNELSGGQLQRVAIARALVKNPDIIMADEPTGALDSKTGESIFELLKKLSREKLVLIVSHDRDFSERYADRIIELSDGRVISDVTLRETSEVTEDENVTFEENSIKINDGFALSDEEFLRIKDYIRSYHGPVDLNLNSRKGQKNYIFEDTVKDNIEMDNSGFALIKSKLSLKNSFKIGASGLAYKKAKLVFTILLSFIAFTFFGLADTAGSYDIRKTTINSIMDTKIDYASFVKKVRTGEDEDAYYAQANFTQSDIDELNERTKLSLKGVYDNSAFSGLGLKHFNSLIIKEDEGFSIDSFYTTSFSGCIEFSASDLSAFGYSLANGSILPDGSKDEIMLTKYEAMSFVGNKLNVYSDNGLVLEQAVISKEEDLIGKSLYLGGINYKITAIIDTNMDTARFEILKEEITDAIDLNYYALSLELSSLKENSLHNLLFVGEGFTDRKGISALDAINYYSGGTSTMTNSDEDEITYMNTVYISQYSYLDLLKEEQNHYYIIGKNGDVNDIGNDEIILSEYAIYDLINYAFYKDYDLSQTNASTYNEIYNINGADYNIFYFLGLDGNATLYDLYVKLNPALSYYSSYKFALYSLSQEYDKWYNLASSANAIHEGTEIQDLVNYIVKEAKTEDYGSMKGNDLFKVVREYNALALYKMYQEVTNESVKLEFSPYLSNNLNNSYTLNVIGVAYSNDYYNLVFAVLNDEMWDRYFDIDPYAVFNFAVGELNLSRDLVKKLVDISYDESGNVKYELKNNVIDEIGGLKDILDTLGTVFFYIGLIFAIFASLLLSNFIATSISYKKTEIGILRAIGSRSGDVFRIFFSEAFIIAMINFVLSSLATFAIANAINKALREEVYLQITVFPFGIRQVILLFILCTASAIVSSFLPVYKNARKKPIDAIRNR